MILKAVVPKLTLQGRWIAVVQFWNLLTKLQSKLFSAGLNTEQPISFFLWVGGESKAQLLGAQERKKKRKRLLLAGLQKKPEKKTQEEKQDNREPTAAKQISWDAQAVVVSLELHGNFKLEEEQRVALKACFGGKDVLLYSWLTLAREWNAAAHVATCTNRRHLAVTN